MYRATYRQYWACSNFVIKMPPGLSVSLVREQVMSLDNDDLQYVNSLVLDFRYLVSHRGTWANVEWTLVDPRGAWKVNGTSAHGRSRLVFWAMGEGEGGGPIKRVQQFNTGVEAITACSGLKTPILRLQLSAILMLVRNVQNLHRSS